MLSYRHSFHAGNHADILKHSALIYLLNYLNRKQNKNWTFIDAFAGQGIYSLDSQDLLKTGEGQQGIEKLYSKKDQVCSELLKSYLEFEAPYLEKRLYAGSPEIARQLSKKTDTLFLNDAQKSVYQDLCKNMTGRNESGKKIFVKNLMALPFENGTLPELNKRGINLIDPSYEDKSDFQMVKDIAQIHQKKFHTGTLFIWYPLLTRRKNETADMTFYLETMAKTSNPIMDFCNIRLELFDPQDFSHEEGSHLYGSGLFIINPPYQFSEKMEESAGEIKSLLS